MDKTSKVKKIWKITERKSPKWVIIYYHNLEMENWDFINLGKQKENVFKVWDEITYIEEIKPDWKKRYKEKRSGNLFKTKEFLNNKQISALAWAIIIQNNNDLSFKQVADWVYQRLES